jgi:hypothetical protein
MLCLSSQRCAVRLNMGLAAHDLKCGRPTVSGESTGDVPRVGNGPTKVRERPKSLEPTALFLRGNGFGQGIGGQQTHAHCEAHDLVAGVKIELLGDSRAVCLNSFHADA